MRLLYAPLWLAVRLSDQRSVINADLAHWMTAEKRSASGVMGERTWRAQLLFRLRRGNKPAWLIARLWCVLVGFERTLILDAEIGPGLYVQHGLATIVVARTIGKNCRVNQQVTVGWSKGGCPVIGDNVEIKAGAKVLGAITVGNDVRVGANGVVLKDVPDGLTVVGVPTHHYGAHKAWLDDSPAGAGAHKLHAAVVDRDRA